MSFVRNDCKSPHLQGFFCTQTLTTILTSFIPAGAGEYCQQLWQQYQFDLRIVRPRQTRLGDFRVLPGGQTRITINANLNLYAFLITYVHEVAHADVNHQRRAQGRRKRIAPHGEAWQTAFQRLMQPILTEAIFPTQILRPLLAYMARPAATTSAHPALMHALRQADPMPVGDALPDRVLLGDVPEGQPFRFAKKTYVRGTLRRTRIVCKEVASGRSYAILSHAWVETV